MYTFNNICDTWYILCKMNLQSEFYFIFYKYCFPDILLSTTNTVLNTNALNVSDNIEGDIQASSDTTFCNMEQCDRYDKSNSNSIPRDININNLIKDIANMHEDATIVNENRNLACNNSNDINGKY